MKDQGRKWREARDQRLWGGRVEAEKTKNETLIKAPWRLPGAHAQGLNGHLLCC